MWRGLMILGGVIALWFLVYPQSFVALWDGAPDAGLQMGCFLCKAWRRSFHLD